MKYSNRNYLIEDVGMDTYFQPMTGHGGVNYAQLFVGFMSRMINIYFMPSKEHGNIMHAYKDFMKEEGVPTYLHRDFAPEQKVQEITNINHDMRVKDSFSEPGCQSQNPVENLGVKIIKMAVEGLKIRIGALDFVRPLMHQFLCQQSLCLTIFRMDHANPKILWTHTQHFANSKL